MLVAVLTDGHENASREHTINSLAALISRYQARPNWTFAFLSAAHDTVEDARDFAELLSSRWGEHDSPCGSCGFLDHLARNDDDPPREEAAGRRGFGYESGA